ncbi:hypothetical protein ACFCZQ_09320 [Streptomyces virginiae]|uniref:hypothetical protein n=1 Tax=Streptomyces virginiae TaxID=1961 RepID=UPI0035D86532
MSKSKFVEDALGGAVGPNDIDSYIDAWHDGEGAELELHEFLGMTWDEYRLWVEKPVTLRYILSARRNGRTVSEELAKNTGGVALAARAESAKEAESVLSWLRKTGRL